MVSPRSSLRPMSSSFEEDSHDSSSDSSDGVEYDSDSEELDKYESAAERALRKRRERAEDKAEQNERMTCIFCVEADIDPPLRVKVKNMDAHLQLFHPDEWSEMDLDP